MGCVDDDHQTKTIPPLTPTLTPEAVQTYTPPASSQQLQEQPEKMYHRKNLTRFKGVWPSPGKIEELLDSESEIKDLGVNIIPLNANYCIRGDEIKQVVFGPPWMTKNPEDYVIENIKKAHQKGFAVFLELNTLAPGCDMVIQNKDKFIEDFIHESKKWAEIAERYQVEMFSPLNEPNLVLGEKGFEWAQKVLPEVKEVYSGDVVLKIADRPKPGNYSGYDYLAIDIFPGEINYWREDIKTAVSEMEAIVRMYNLKGGIIGELGAPTQIGPGEDERLVAGKIVDQKTQAQIFQIAFEEAWNKTDGFFVLAWSKNQKLTYNFHGFEAEKVIKNWYTGT